MLEDEVINLVVCSASSPRNVLEMALNAELIEYLGDEYGETPDR